MRAALIVPVSADPGDDEASLLHRHRYNVAQAKALGHAGAEVELIVDAPFSAETRVAEHARVVFAHRAARLPLAAHLIVRAVRDRAEVLHVFHLLSVKSVALAALAPARVFAEYNGGAIPLSPLRRAVLAAASRRLSGAFFTGREAGSAFVEAGALARSTPLHAVPEVSSLLPDLSATELGALRAAARAERGVGEALVVLVVGRLAADKQPFVALEAFRAIARARPDAILWWAHGGDELDGALQRAAAHDGARVTFFERIPYAEMSRLYAAADVMIHATRRETCSAAFIEAMQHGLPVAASNIPPLAAMSGPGSALVPLGDASALARAALSLAGEPEHRTAARRTFAESLSYEAIGRRKLEAYSAHTH